jgi:hypothetical protein
MYMTDRSRHLSELVGLSALAGVAVAFLVLFGVVSNEAPSNPSFGPRAGYAWRGHVTSLRGSWTVPRILSGSKGSASTWIGVQAPGTPRPFIQIGSTEVEGFHPGDAPEAHYDTFWSDVRGGSHPHLLFRVNPGDDLSASLTRSHNGWTLHILDTSTGAAERFSSRAEASAPFEEAEWTQEDVADGAAKPLPYPRLSAVGFRRVAVNSVAPSSSHLSAEWMSANGKSIAPSALHDGSFTLEPAPALTAPGKQYLRISGPEDAAGYAFYAQFARWTAATPYSQIAAASSRFATALQATMRAVAEARWPSTAEGHVRALMDDIRTLLAHLRYPSSRSPRSLAAWRAALTREAQADPVGDAEALLRRVLNVPLVPVR